MSLTKMEQKIKSAFKSKKVYRTTYKDIKIYFKLLNKLVFGSKLPVFNDVEIKNLIRQKCWGQVVVLENKNKGTALNRLEMDKYYETKKDFLDTLVHEMVHHYQFLYYDSGRHNKLFYSFEPKIKKLGLIL